MIQIHYALQTCDSSSNQNQERYCSNDRTLISKKCITSFFKSIKYVSNKNTDVYHIIKIFEDKCTEDLKSFLNEIKNLYEDKNITIKIEHTNSSGIMQSIENCYLWLKYNGKDLIFQVQDDYLFTEDSIFQMIDMFMQIYNDINLQPFISGYNDACNWYCKGYRYKSTPRMVVPGMSQYWIQMYDISCSFLTSHFNFIKHWDIMEYFLSLNPTGKDLENVSLNRILVDRNELGLMPFSSISLHMQSETEKDPYIDWTKIWNKQDIKTKLNLPEKVLLNIGSGKDKLNYKSLSDFDEIRMDLDPNVNPDILGNILDLSKFKSESVDVIWASHILEHLHTKQVPEVLKSTYRILKPNGIAIFIVPNLSELGKYLISQNIHEPIYISDAGPITSMDILYGLISGNEYMSHKTGFTEKYAIDLLKNFNLNGYTKTIEHNLFILISKTNMDQICVNVDEVIEEFFK